MSCVSGLSKLITEYEFTNKLFSCMSKQEVILFCALFKISLTENQKKRYYRTSYIEDGIVVINFNKDKSGVITSLENLQTEMDDWTGIHEYQLPLQLEWTHLKDNLYIQLYAGGIKIRSKVTRNSRRIIRRLENTFCWNHKVGINTCNDLGIRNLGKILQSLAFYNTTDLIDYSSSLYSCSPSTVQSIIVDKSY